MPPEYTPSAPFSIEEMTQFTISPVYLSQLHEDLPIMKASGAFSNVTVLRTTVQNDGDTKQTPDTQE